MNREQDFNACPELTEEYMQEINRRFEPYLFYETTRAGGREFWCTSCNQHFIYERVSRTMEPDYLIPLQTGHNHYAKCPKCGRTVQYKNVGKAKKRVNLWECTPAVFIIPESENKVYIRAFYAAKDYGKELLPEVKLSETARYMFVPGEAVMWKYEYDYYGFGVLPSGKVPSMSFVLQKNPCKEPINGYYNPWTYQYFGGYELIGYESLKDTFLKYSQLDGFGRRLIGDNRNTMPYVNIPMVKYLCHYAQTPQIEILAKLGHWDFILGRVLNNRPNKRLINWDAKTPTDFFKLSKQEYRDFRTAGGEIELLKLYKHLKKKKIQRSFAQCQNILDKLGSIYCYECIDLSIEHRLNFTRLCNYIKKQSEINKISHTSWQNTFMYWRDYLQSAKKLGYDLQLETVLLPKDIKEAHDTAAKNVEWKEEQDKKAIMRNLQPGRIKQYQYESDTFFIKVPESMQEIIDEGKALQHCVGGYASRHAEGKLTILFMRRKDEPNKSLYTIEMNGKSMIQVHGFNNCSIQTEEEKKFFNEWLAWGAAGSKKQKVRERARVSA